MSAIKVGDLVMVLGAERCGCVGPEGGGVFTVHGIYTPGGPTGSFCNECGASLPLELTAELAEHKWGDVSAFRLRKLDPGTEPADVVTEIEAERPKRVTV